MKLLSTTTLGLVTATVLVGGVLLACAGSEPTTETDVQPVEPAPTATPLPPSTATAKAPEKVCATSCKADSECASSCPDTAGAIACCDTQTGTCYASKQATCPAPVVEDDAGTPSY